MLRGTDSLAASSSDWEEATVQDLVACVFAHTGHDFSNYKRSTILRRTERRMALHQVSDARAYVRVLQQSPDEVQALFEDFLIGVTSFFRDPAAFEALRLRGLPRLLESIPDGEPIRVWVPGCATGEESYSIAILLHEQITALNRRVAPQIFATDIDARALQFARAGVYPSAIANDVSEERIKRFFVRQGPDFRIDSRLRNSLVFATQDLVRDPPFSGLHIISCRNLLIYMNPSLQEEVLPAFAKALRPGGALLLGAAESLGNYEHVFSTIDRKARLYQRDATGAGECSTFERRFFAWPRAAHAYPEANTSALAPRTQSEDPVPNLLDAAASPRSMAEAMPVANEELTVANEKLLSINEELETSREELHSVNEELFRLNGELQDKVSNLKKRNNDMFNVLTVLHLGLLCVDNELRIKRFTPAVTELINIIPADIGRPLDDLSSNFQDYDCLHEDVRATLGTLVSKSLELRSTAGKSYRLKIQPYRTTDNAIEGALLAFVDISEVMELKEALVKAQSAGR